MRIKIVFLLLLSFTLFVFAGNEPDVDTVKTYPFDPVTITATRTEVVKSSITPTVSVIPQAVLAANTHKSILTLVGQQVPGVFVQERGILGFGVTTSSAGQMSIRGVGGNPNTQILMMIDGRPQFAGIFGHPLADSYLSASAERVEVVRGPASVLYGSNAMGGVINIITHSTQKPGISGEVTLSYGSYNSQHLAGKFGYSEDGWNTTASFTRAHTDGHRPFSEFNANSGYVKATREIDEKFKVTIDGSLTGFTSYDPGTIYAPKTKNNFIDINRGYAGVSVDNDHGISKGSTRFVYNFGHHKIFDGSDWVSDDYNAIFSAYQTITLISDNAITTGFDFNKFGGNAKSKTRDFGAPSAYEYAIYADVRHTLFNQLVLNGGLRFNRNEIFGSIVIPQFGAVYRLDNETSVRGSAAKGYRSPTLAEMYLFAPTITLKPENMWNYEIGVSHIFANRVSTELVGFLGEGSNLIRVAAFKPGGRVNTGSFVHRGVELSASAFISSELQINSNYSFIDPGKDTRSIPKHKVFIGGDYKYDIATFSLSILHVEGLFGSDNSKDRLPNYTNIGAKVSAQILPRILVHLSIENLLDEKYHTMYGYPMPGTTISVGAKAGL